MRHLSAWWAAGLVAAAAGGCGPGKELPGEGEVPRPVEQAGPPPDPNGPVPAASEPAAKAVLVRAVKAIAGDTPDGLAKAKVSRVVRDGRFQADRKEMSDATCRQEGVWPDRGHVVFDLDQVKATCRFRNRQGWLTQGLVNQNLNAADLGRIFRADFHARHWLPLGLTLADEKTVAFGKAVAAGGTAVKVAVTDPPDLPVFLVTFDDKTGLPVRVEYHPFESGQRVPKVFVMSDHKPFAGFLLPGDTKFTQNGRLGEHWTTKSWEFPEKLDESLFDPPMQ